MTLSKGALRASCLAAAALHMSLAATPIAAQPAASARYELPAQALGETLRNIARVSGREILFAEDAVRGKRAPALSGTMTFEQALAAALAGSGLVADEREGAVLIRPRAQPAGEAAEAAGNVITVTGTRIRGAESPSPVRVATRQSLEDAGIADMAGFSRILPQNYTGGQNPGVAGGGDQGGQNNLNNSTTLNLRGLGPDATLTLVNGHRLAYDALNQGVDIAAIPLAAIERIEVIADGASALYGSDAVAGVVNVLLRRDYAGLETSARLGASTDGGNGVQQYGAVSGARWDAGGLMLAADFSRNTPILAADRAYTRQLSDAQTLLTHQRQWSAVLAGHHTLMEGLTFELDAQFADRRSRKATAFTTTSDPLTNGLVNRPSVRSYAVAPSVRVALPAAWEATLEATHSASRTKIATRNARSGGATLGDILYENRLTAIEASAEGPLARLPGGEARLALGGGYRRFALDILTSQTPPGGALRVTRDAIETRESLFAYGELSLPLVGADNRLPLVHALELSGAVRYERYRGIDEVATPKLGFIYAPHRDVTLKASWGKSFKIPTLNQVNQVEDGSLFAGSLFAPQPVPPLPAGASVLLLSGGDRDLRAERATSWTATLILTPRLLEGLRIEASWFDIDYRGRIASPISGILSALANPAYGEFVRFDPSADDVLAIVADLPLGLVNQSGQPFDPARVAAIIDARLRNTARERAHGLDLAANYRIDLGEADRLQLSAAASWLDAERQLSAGQAVLERAGLIFTPPHWRARAGANWTRGNVQLAAFLNHAGATSDNRFATSARIGAFTTLDLSASVRTGTEAGALRDMELRLSAQNLLNETPDPIRTSDPAAIPYDSTNQSPIGRFVSLTLSKSW